MSIVNTCEARQPDLPLMPVTVGPCCCRGMRGELARGTPGRYCWSATTTGTHGRHRGRRGIISGMTRVGLSWFAADVLVVTRVAIESEAKVASQHDANFGQADYVSQPPQSASHPQSATRQSPSVGPQIHPSAQAGLLPRSSSSLSPSRSRWARLLAFSLANIRPYLMTQPPRTTALRHPSDLVRIEAQALEQLAQRLEGPQQEVFEQVASLLAATARSGHRVVLTGIGKSGLIARKIAATLLSTGTAAQFLHPTEALHGDLGLLTRGDVLLALSYSGASEELLRLLPVLPHLGVTLVSLTGCDTSPLAKASAHVLDVSVDREACNHQLAPTASTTVMLALGDALAIDVSRRLDFQPQDFAELHPGGQLGKRLLPITSSCTPVTRSPSSRPPQLSPRSSTRCPPSAWASPPSRPTVELLGVLSDGDLRRLFASRGPDAFHLTAANILNPQPRTIAPTPFAADALALMERHKITALVVTAGRNSRALPCRVSSTSTTSSPRSFHR